MTTVMCGNKEYYIESGQKDAYENVFSKYSNDMTYILLTTFDPLLLASHDKSWIVEQEFMSRVWRAAGHVEGVVLQHGKSIEPWHYKIKAKEISFKVYPFQPCFSIKHMEQSCEQVAHFFKKPIGDISIKEDFI